MNLWPYSAFFLIQLLLFFSCGSKDIESPVQKSSAGQLDDAVEEPEKNIHEKEFDENDIMTDILDSAMLTRMEKNRLSLNRMLAVQKNTGEDTEAPNKTDTNKTMWEDNPNWRGLAIAMTDSIEAIKKEVKKPLVIEHKDALSFPAGNVGRALDVRWLRSDIAFFELAGIVNRFDRIDFTSSQNCGELRLVYRLAYRTKSEKGQIQFSRLPLTLNLVLQTSQKTNCSEIAREWIMDKGETKEELVLKNIEKLNLNLKQIEVNAQIIRFPSGLETEFAGQAIYLLKVFRIDEKKEGKITELTLENTPDVQKILADPDLKEELLDHIRDNLEEIDMGLHQLPEKFLSKGALSYSTLGVNRLANKPFDVLLANELDRLPQPQEGMRFLKSKKSIVERLNNSSCMGCHQSQSTAGFHLLGFDRENSAGVTNRIQIPNSEHYKNEINRRRAYLNAVARGEKPNRHRPHSISPEMSEAYMGSLLNMPCVPQKHFGDLAEQSQWGCRDSNAECRILVKDERVGINFGQCVPKEKENLSAGQSCREGAVKSGETGEDQPFNLHGYSDTFRQRKFYDLPEDKKFKYDEQNCRPTRIGVPLGRTYRRCTKEERSLKEFKTDPADIEICGVVGGSKFDLCVEGDFHSCLEGIVGRGMVSACGPNLFCREDYICQQLPWQLKGVPDDSGKRLTESGIGFCTPTYFLFQLRLDGHPVPKL